MIWRKRRFKGRLLEGYHWQPSCRWWPTVEGTFEEYPVKPWGDMCNQCKAIEKRSSV